MNSNIFYNFIKPLCEFPGCFNCEQSVLTDIPRTGYGPEVGIVREIGRIGLDRDVIGLHELFSVTRKSDYEFSGLSCRVH